MRDLKPKFIIENGYIIIGKCELHIDMVKEPKNIAGGGWFHWNDEDKSFLLYGGSADFGPASLTDITDAIKSGNVGERHRPNEFKDFKFYYSTKHQLTDAVQDKVLITI